MVVVDRIERHDVLNAVLLAIAMLVLGFLLVRGFGALFNTLDEGVVVAEKEEAASSTTTTSEPAPEETTTIVASRPPDEVLVRVANGARRAGVAGAGTETLDAAGYATLSPKNGPTVDDSVVYYRSGYAADAAKVAEVLGLDPTQIEPMPADPGVDIGDAKVLALLGINSNY